MPVRSFESFVRLAREQSPYLPLCFSYIILAFSPSSFLSLPEKDENAETKFVEEVAKALELALERIRQDRSLNQETSGCMTSLIGILHDPCIMGSFAACPRFCSTIIQFIISRATWPRLKRRAAVLLYGEPIALWSVKRLVCLVPSHHPTGLVVLLLEEKTEHGRAHSDGPVLGLPGMPFCWQASVWSRLLQLVSCALSFSTPSWTSRTLLSASSSKSPARISCQPTGSL